MTIIEPDIREETKISLDEGDHERLTHIVFKAKGDKRSAAAIVTEARVMGTEVLAYCGKVWVPERNPENYPVCQGCIENWEKLSGKTWGGRR